VLDAGIAWLRAMQPPPRDYGLLHGDFELDNLVWDGRRWQALDFDGATYGWCGVDIAIALQDVASMADERREAHLNSFRAGYAQVRPLPDGAWEAMPRILALVTAAKISLLRRAYRDVLPDADSPAWLVKMRAYHERWLAAKRETLDWP
jgi:Ser/Thr protein kinase RdoA (MazF antagonist)